MTEQPTTIAPVHPQTDGGLSPEKVREINDQRMRADQEHKDRMSRIDAAWSSPEARAVHEIVQQDGNVDWRPFVQHAGGILAVVDLVDGGRPDTRRIIPLVDELFAKNAKKALQGGITMTLGPRNRPYPHGPAPVRQTDRDVTQADAERLLEDAQQTPPRTTAPR